MQNISFFIELDKVPTTTAQQKKVTVRNGKPIFYEDERLAEARALFMSRLDSFKPKQPLCGAVELVVTWCFPETKSKKHGTPMTNKPDLDNIQKLLNDCLTRCGFWKDDSYVVRMILEKFHSEVVGVRIQMREL